MSTADLDNNEPQPPTQETGGSRYVKPGSLYIVATPLGCLDDITLRAINVLTHVDWIGAEDTRHSRRLLDHLGIQKRLIALHDHNERDQAEQLVQRIHAGESAALISDAGTPLISDPGYRLVKAAHEAGVTVSPIPGACAALAAISTAGLATDRFLFAGFLPAKTVERKKQLSALREESSSLIFYLSPHQLKAQLSDIAEILGNERPATIARELTKRHEQIVHDSLSSLLNRVEDDIPIKGEFTLCVAGNDAPQSALAFSAEQLMNTLLPHLPRGKSASIASQLTGISRKELYQVGADQD